MGMTGHRSQDRQSLCRDLNAELTKEVRCVTGHADTLDQLLLECIKY